MINNIKYLKHISTSVLMVAVFMLSLTSCEFDLPEANSKPDDTPPSADFGATVTEDYLEYNFANFSISATDYEWDFGDGSTSTSQDPTHVYAEEATDEEGTPYTVTLSASDKLGVVSTVSKEIIVLKPEVPVIPIPVILEPGFEDLSLPDGTGDGRDSWRSSFGSIMQITGSPVSFGDQAAKFPSDGGRTAYQEIAVTKNVDFVLTYHYTIKTSPVGSITVAILGGSISDLSEAAGATITLFTGTDQDDANTYVQVDLPFNSGDNSTIAILITNEGAEARIDEFSIALKEE